MPSFLVLTLGCKLNQLESEAVIDAFEGAGDWKQGTGDQGSETGNEARDSVSVIVINTCTVTSKADQKARRVIRKALRDYPEARILVTGCYAQLNKNDILKLETDSKNRLFVVDKNNIINYINNTYPASVYKDSLIPDPETSIFDSKFQFNPKRFSCHTRSFLKIQDGCDKHCTYCKIRLARGKSVSLDADEALRRLRVLEGNHAETVLTGVNISQYEWRLGDRGQEFGNGLAGLLKYLISNTDKIAVRLSSLAPESIDDKLAEILAHPRIRPHFHLSVQSGCGKILDKMGRSYDGNTIEKAVSLLRRVKDDPFIACDIIAGFPGETGEDYEETFNLCKNLDFAWIHAFPYSKRDGTPAFLFKDNVPENEITKRIKTFSELAWSGRKSYINRQLGRETDVIVMNNGKLMKCRGVTENYLNVLIKHNEENKPKSGTVLRCKLAELNGENGFDAAAVVKYPILR